jgi:peroxiredoxin
MRACDVGRTVVLGVAAAVLAVGGVAMSGPLAIAAPPSSGGHPGAGALPTGTLPPAGGHPATGASPSGAPATAAAHSPGGRPRVGDRAPAFVLTTADGAEPRSLDELVHAPGKRGAVLVFISARCPYVAQARQPLADLFKKYGEEVVFAGLNANQNESADDVKTDARNNFAFPILRDEGSKVADLYAAERTPEVFLVDAKGVIRYHGGVADLAAALGDFTAGRTLAKSEAKAFGCTIKRKP